MIYTNKSPEMKLNIKKEKNNIINEYSEIDCICDNKNYDSKSKIIKCFLCHKFQHLSCICQGKFIKPYICFNCQFKNNHFYLRWIKTILPAKEIIYLNKWTKDKSLLSKGTKKFKFCLNLNELYNLNKEKNSKNENSSYFMALLWMTNNGKPFHFGFPDNISIKINNNEFYSTDNKGFKYPLLISLDKSNDYYPKKKNLITNSNFEIPHVSEFFFPPRIINYKKKSSKQSITISFDNPLENYYGSEFQFEETRRYLFYIGVFQEIKIPQISNLKNTNKLEKYNYIFKNVYKEKVIKMKWNKISHNLITSDNEEMNINFLSNISNQKIIHPIRGIFCQHSEVLDFGECCRYISSKNQIYKCYKCNKPLNIMYIDDSTEKIFNEYKNKNYSEIYINDKFKFIRGEKNNMNDSNYIEDSEEIEEDESDEESDSLNESFFKYYQIEFKKNKNGKKINLQKSIKTNDSLIDDNNDSVIELNETITLSNDSEIELLNKSEINRFNSSSLISGKISKDFNNNKNNMKENKNKNSKEKTSIKNNFKFSKNNEFSFSILDKNSKKDIIKKCLRIEGFSFEEKGINKNQNIRDNNFLQKKRENSKIGKNDRKINVEKRKLISNKNIKKILINNNKKKSLKNNISLIKKKVDDIFNEEVIELSQSNDSSTFMPINNEIEIKNNNNSNIQNSTTNKNKNKINKIKLKNKSNDISVNAKNKNFSCKK